MGAAAPSGVQQALLEIRLSFANSHRPTRTAPPMLKQAQTPVLAPGRGCQHSALHSPSLGSPLPGDAHDSRYHPWDKSHRSTEWPTTHSRAKGCCLTASFMQRHGSGLGRHLLWVQSWAERLWGLSRTDSCAVGHHNSLQHQQNTALGPAPTLLSKGC